MKVEIHWQDDEKHFERHEDSLSYRYTDKMLIVMYRVGNVSMESHYNIDLIERVDVLQEMYE
jgi:hypothetical protein